MSPKNKGKFGKGKPTIEPQDEFVSGVQRVSERLRPHAAKIFTFLAVVLIGVAGWSTWKWLQHRKATKATGAYAEAMHVSRLAVEPPPAPADADGGVPEPVEEPDELRGEDPTFPSIEEQQRAVLSELEEISGSAKIADEARLIRAATHLRLGEYDRAIELYREYRGPSSVQWLAREGIGYALEAKATAEKDDAAHQAGLREALEAFRSIADEPGQPGYDNRLWHEARLLNQLGERDQAVATFEKLRDLDPPSPKKQAAEARLALLKARKVATGSAPPAPAAGTAEPAPAPAAGAAKPAAPAAGAAKPAPAPAAGTAPANP